MARQRRHSGGPTRTITLLLAAGLVVVAGAGLAVAAQDQFEPNDEPETAATIDDGTYEGLTLSGLDYYEFDLAAGETLEATIEFTHDDGDLDMRLYDGADSDARIIGESASYEDEESITHTAAEDETVQLLVYTETSSNDYTLTVSTEENASRSDGSDDDSTDDSSMDSSDGDDAASGDGSDTDGGSDDSGGDDGLPGFGVVLAIGALAAVGAGAAARHR